jgi:allophanate hydrolase subunit 2
LAISRTGVQRFGVIASGVMDSGRIGWPICCRQCADEASLEITLMAQPVFHQDALIAIVGADLSPRSASRPCR